MYKQSMLPPVLAPFHPSTITTRVTQALDALKQGKMILLFDDAGRENEGDLCMAAQFVSPECINFMATHARGLICLALCEEQVDRIGLPPMHRPGGAAPRRGTAFTVSIEAHTGVSTGISAADRSHTIRVASDPTCRPGDLVTPGHVFPLRARRGGVLVRNGQTEGVVDCMRLAHLTPAGVICEVMNPDGTMARLPALQTFAAQHELCLLSNADLMHYRLSTETLVTPVSTRALRLDATGTAWTAHLFASTFDKSPFLALVKGDITHTSTDDPTLCFVHTCANLADLFSSPLHETGPFQTALKQIEAEGRGVLLCPPPEASSWLEQDPLAEKTTSSWLQGSGRQLRDIGLSAQILRQLGIQALKLPHGTPPPLYLEQFAHVVRSTS